MKTIVSIYMLLCSVFTAPAIGVIGTAENVGMPAGDCGYSSQVAVGGGTGTIVESTNRNKILTVPHVSVTIGSTITVDGMNYTVISTEVSPLGLWKVITVNGQFPTNRMAPLYEGNSEMGKQVYVHGRGPRRGDVITSIIPQECLTPVEITSMTVGETNVTLHIAGESGRQFTIEKMVNGIWKEVGTFTTCSSQTICIPKCCSPSVFFRAKSLSTMTNGFMFGTSDGQISSGRNNVEYVDGTTLRTYFNNNGDPLEASTGPGDSGGGLFIEVNGRWHLAGGVENSQSYLWGHQSGLRFMGPITDMSGLWISNMFGTESWSWQGGAKPTYTTYHRINAEIDWLKDAINR